MGGNLVSAQPIIPSFLPSGSYKSIITKMMFLRVAFLLQLVRLSQVEAQGCAETCPPINFGTPVPSLCEGDMATDFANIDREYETCHPVEGASFKLRDFMGPGRVTVISNFYIGCNAVSCVELDADAFFFLHCFPVTHKINKLSRDGEKQASSRMWHRNILTNMEIEPILSQV